MSVTGGPEFAERRPMTSGATIFVSKRLQRAAFAALCLLAVQLVIAVAHRFGVHSDVAKCQIGAGR